MRRLALAIAVFLICVDLIGIPARSLAGSFVVNPLRIVLSQDRPIATLEIRNDGTEETVVHQELYRWEQRDGEDFLTPIGDEFILCPPIFSLAPGDAQTVRVGAIGLLEVQEYEQAYRLVLQEVPSAAPASGEQVRLALRISLPVFVLPDEITRQEVSWGLMRSANGYSLKVANAGPFHLLVTEIELRAADASFSVRIPMHKYVLPGSTVEQALDSEALSSGVVPRDIILTVETDQGRYETALTVGE